MLIDTQGKSMPAALERKLKRQAAADPSIKDKDAYVYGTLRKTGWKPSTQKKKTKKMNDPSETIQFGALSDLLAKGGKQLEGLGGKIYRNAYPKMMASLSPARRGLSGGEWSHLQGDIGRRLQKTGSNLVADYGGGLASKVPGNQNLPKTWGFDASSKLIRLAQIDNQLDSIVRFAYDDEETRTKGVNPAAVAAGAAGVGAGGVGAYLAHRGIQATGGYGAQLGAIQKGFGRGVRGTGLSGIKAGAGRFIGQYAGKAWGGLKSFLKLGSQERMIHLDEKILEPFGAEEKSKIAQEQFPAGLSPAAALKLPFPELMKLLKQRNILQQQFSKLGKLTELKSKLDGLVRT